MKRRLLIWSFFLVCLAVAFGAMAWLSLRSLQLEANERHARHRAKLEENTRAALWRMDYGLAPLVAQEASFPYRAYTDPVRSVRVQKEIIFVFSPIIVQRSQLLPLHFQIDQHNSFRCVERPAEYDDRVRLQQRGLSEEHQKIAAERLARLKELTDYQTMLGALPEPRALPGSTLIVANTTDNNGNWNSIAQNAVNPQGGNYQYPVVNSSGQKQQTASQAQIDYDLRQQVLRGVNDWSMWNNGVLNSDQQFGPNSSTIREGPMRALWVGDELVLARRVFVDAYDQIQGVLIDWPELKSSLLASISDLLPGADLVGVADSGAQPKPGTLAALPVVRLVTDNVRLDLDEKPSPIRMTLWLAWGGAILASLAMAILLKGVMALSERRAAFVSAVTHELRTPLTTLRMYTEMLADGMVAEPHRQQSYLGTLRSEADRLGHLVENVLGYSRLERRRRSGRAERLELGPLLDSIGSRLADRAQQAGMHLEVEVPPDLMNRAVMVDPVAVEQILFNLIDNACKYAHAAADKRIALQVASAGRQAAITVRDHGPGLGPEQQRKLFRAFSKSVNEAANTAAPGLGLGLALSRRLARDMGGDLRHVPTERGACFVVQVPWAGE